MDAPPPDPAAPRRAVTPWVGLTAFVALLAAAYLAARALGLDRLQDFATLAETVRGLRGRRAIVPLFVAAYAVASAFGLPGLIFTLAGGALFGTVLGTLVNWAGATAGATLAYLLARTLGGEAVRRLLGRHAASLDRAVRDAGFLGLLRLRLIPVMPFNALNFAAGLAGIPLRAYVLATALGILPGTAVYTFFADSLLSGAAGARQDALVRVAGAGALLLLLSFAPAFARRMGWVAPAVALSLGARAVPPPPPAQSAPPATERAASVGAVDRAPGSR